MYKLFFLFCIILVACKSMKNPVSKKKDLITVIAYYSGNETQIDKYDVSKLTHIIFSFCHLKGNKLNVDDAQDSTTIIKLVSLKKQHPKLKVLLSLGGWGGCKFCSQSFASAEGRKEFAQSTKGLNDYFNTDGIDLDWEYPAIEGYPDHQFIPEDKTNFTALIKELRDVLGNKHTISFAAGGFTKFINESIDWDKVMPLIDMVNLMSYDLVSGFSSLTGHHTPLYSTSQTIESADKTIQHLNSIGVSKNKIVIGAAFYARVWENVAPENNGLYQTGKFKNSIPYRNFDKHLSKDSGYVHYWDGITKAPYAYHPSKKLYATFDDSTSVRLKTEYTINQGLNGIMFWELTLDKHINGLLDVIDKTKNKY